MSDKRHLVFKLADKDEEFEAIHRLNYKTFVEEIPQHSPHSDLCLVDRFHSENTYAVCLCDGRLAGMVAGRGTRPFSLDAKLDNLESFLPPYQKVVEVRLLAVEKEYRSGTVCCRLIGMIARHFIDQGYDMGVLSGSVRQIRLYKHIGCVPFGPLVGRQDAQFQPMYITLETFRDNGSALSPPRFEVR